jgi:TRAP-type C4-dicarboxylate transport system substrate-binding protein
VIQLPFLIDSYELEAKVLQLPEWKAILAKANEDLGQCTIISVAEFGIREIATTTKMINTMADMKNLRMRTAGNPVVDDAMKLVGASPVIVEYSELYSALQNRIIDSEEVNVATVSM